MTRLLLGASFLVITLASPRSEACSPVQPAVTGTVPASGEAYPVNAPIQINGFDINASKLTATIDGVAAQLTKVSGLAGQGFQLTPAPQVGQTVHVVGTACEGNDTKCQVDLTFTGGEADTTPPGAISAISFDAFDYPDVKGGGGSCVSDSDLQLYVHVTSQDVSGATPETWLVDGLDAATGKELLFSGTYRRTKADQIITVTLNKEALQGVMLPSGLCLELTGLDLAGNKGTPVRQCLPCRYRAADDGTTQSWTPDEPTWTAGDVVAGGSCDAGTSGGSGHGGGGPGGGPGSAGSGGGPGGSGNGPALDGVSSDDGGCAAARGRAGAGGWLAGLALGLAAIVRRRGGSRS